MCNAEKGSHPVVIARDHSSLVGEHATTFQLMRLVGVQPGMEVLDVGGGLGGSARTLTVEAACRVTALDLTEEYCRVGQMLTARTGLSDRVSFRQGNALQMPFADAHFDVV
jgi:ubiquinone/menaquinone biosynthesis C-methylase UbiE